MKKLSVLKVLAVVLLSVVTSAATSFAGDEERIIVINDLEGRIDPIRELVKAGFLKVDAQGRLGFVNSTDILIHNGDAFNRGGDDFVIAQVFDDLQSRFPKQFYLTMGNHEGVYLRFIRDYRELQKKYNNDPVAILEAWHTAQGHPNVRENLESYRAQLEKFLKKPQTLADAAAYKIKSILPGGTINNVIGKCNLVYYILEKKLLRYWDHGGLTRRNFLKIPGQVTVIADQIRWFNALNQWKRDEFALINKQFLAGLPVHSNLIDYADAVWDPKAGKNGQSLPEGVSVIYSDRVKLAGNMRLDEEFVDQLLEVGQSVADYSVEEYNGHTPVGRHSLPLKYKNYFKYMSDVSYTEEGRSTFFSVIYRDRIYVHSRISPTEVVNYTIMKNDPLVGKIATNTATGDAYHVAFRYDDGKIAMFRYFDGYKTEELKVSEQEFKEKYTVSEPTTKFNAEAEAQKLMLIEYLVANGIPMKSPEQVLELQETAGKTLMLFSGPSKFTDQPESEPDVRRDVKKQLAAGNPMKQTVVTGGTDYGYEKIVHEEVDIWNAEHPNLQYEMGAFIITKTTPSDLHTTLQWVVMIGEDWKDPLMRVIEMVKQLGGRIYFGAGGGPTITAGIKKAMIMGVEFYLKSNVRLGASVTYAPFYPAHAYQDASQINYNPNFRIGVFQSATEIIQIYKSSGKRTLTAIGYSGMGYQDLEKAKRIFQMKLLQFNPKEWAVNAGVTPDGIGLVAQWAKEIRLIAPKDWRYWKEYEESGGYEVRGIVSEQAMKDLQSPEKLAFIGNKTRFDYISSYVDSFHIVAGESWGGLGSDGKLVEVSEAMIGVSDAILTLDAGDVGTAETIEGINRGIKTYVYPMEMNHDKANAKAEKNGVEHPTDYHGGSSKIMTALKERKASNKDGHCTAFDFQF